MKKSKILAVAALGSLILTGCGNNNNNSSSTNTSSSTGGNSSTTTPVSSSIVVETIVVSISGPSEIDTAATNPQIQLEVSVTGTQNTAVTWSSNSTLVTVENGLVTYVGEPLSIDITVGITATSVANTEKSATKTITLKRKKSVGQVGKLTSQMLEDLGNASITVNGTLTDHYKDFTSPGQPETTHNYGMKVEMEQDAWKGSYWVTRNGVEGTHNETSYSKGKTDGLVDANGKSGHALVQKYIDKDNKVASKEDVNYAGYYNLWEENHLWNHIAQLDVNKFKLSDDGDKYEYTIDQTSETDLYLMTYLSYSLTPILSDTLFELSITCDNEKITSLSASTEVLYYGSSDGTAKDADSASWTTIDLTFDNIGTTKVPDITPYAATEYTSLLQTAIDKMKGVKNYTFKAVDTSTYTASSDESSYMRNQGVANKKLPTSSATGSAGLDGYVTADAILLKRTIAYTSYMDDPYGIEWTGYKDNKDGTYDYFAYDASNQALAGKRQYTGDMFDRMPQFNFAAEVFGEPSISTVAGVTSYTFTLRDSAINNQIAPQVSAHSNASNSSANVDTSLSITVDSEGNLLKTVYPYELNSGAYVGYITTTYSNVGTTALDDDTFDNYRPRVVAADWSGFDGEYETAYNSGYTNATADVVLNKMFGDKSSSFPIPQDFRDVFGDSFSLKVSLDYNSNGRASVGFNLSSVNLDSNHRITDWTELMAAFGEIVSAKGYERLSGDRYEKDTQSSKYASFANEDADILIRFENLGYRTIYMNAYKLSES